ncbi:Collagen triple helix repeat-containing protein [Strongyloides ratti]|uniref:Collagen triple helix repeat-containing protein n=1 Tax=Strongyloides ratti TaxID=34506 RepID=A0A090LUE5_STRRB|nr:Collagen triple helix repeat-containing protein [Strongyloides ratti]CEF71219.1 Collagen triple helix repeat-containing protein [Strongyloides ratti]
MVEFENIASIVKEKGNNVWNDVTKIKKNLGIVRSIDKRDAYYGEIENSEDNNYSNTYDKAPTYGYGIMLLKCCCSSPELMKYQKDYVINYKCPVGMKGVKGERGDRGIDGLPGVPGIDGISYPVTVVNSQRFYIPKTDFGYGIESSFNGVLREAIYEEVCTNCPQGPPGLPGPKGPPGVRGPRGQAGIPGRHGKHGKAGKPGLSGDRGEPGIIGPKGMCGVRGLDGYKKTIGRPGAKGQIGASGIPGIRGAQGQTGTSGDNGSRGPPGNRGIKGQCGANGVPGQQGPPGIPGKDGMYCKCPKRTGEKESLVISSYHDSMSRTTEKYDSETFETTRPYNEYNNKNNEPSNYVFEDKLTNQVYHPPSINPLNIQPRTVYSQRLEVSASPNNYNQEYHRNEGFFQQNDNRNLISSGYTRPRTEYVQDITLPQTYISNVHKNFMRRNVNKQRLKMKRFVGH